VLTELDCFAKEAITASWGFDAERSTAVPRHREIDFRLARKICVDLEIPPPTGSR
jgi:hypothetical protein